MKMILSVALFIGFFSGAIAQNAKAPVNAIKKGIASFYHPKFEGRRTATGEVFANKAYTAASNNIRLNTFVKVTNLNNGRVVYVKINDRMSAGNKRMLDMTEAAADQLGYRSAGTTQVKMEVVTEEEGLHGVLAQRDAVSMGRKNTL
jgi:rare lipoprotein A